MHDPSSVLAVAALAVATTAARAVSVSPNTGSLVAAANGTNTDPVTFGPGAVSGAAGDQSAVYDGVAGTKTTVPFQSGLNPPAASPLMIVSIVHCCNDHVDKWL